MARKLKSLFKNHQKFLHREIRNSENSELPKLLRTFASIHFGSLRFDSKAGKVRPNEIEFFLNF